MHVMLLCCIYGQFHYAIIMRPSFSSMQPHYYTVCYAYIIDRVKKTVVLYSTHKYDAEIHIVNIKETPNVNKGLKLWTLWQSGPCCCLISVGRVFWYHAMQILVQLLVVHVETPYDDNADCQIKGGMDH
jgi:hypothetical protein